MKYKYLIFDATNLFWRCFTISLKKSIFELKEQVFLAAIEEFFSKIEKFRSTYASKSTKFYFLFDNPNSVINFRKELDENYKSIRSKKDAPAGFYDTLSKAKEVLKVYSDNFFILTIKGAEADDSTYPLIKTFEKELDDFNRCLCISADLDWARNITENIDWFNFKEIYNIPNFKEEYNFPPTAEKIKLYKSLHGDISDNIPNVLSHAPKKIILDILNTYDSLVDLLKDLDQKFKQKKCTKWELRILENRDAINKNYTLVDFVHLNINLNQYICKCKYDDYQLKFWSDIFGLKLNNCDLNKANFQNAKEFFK